MAENKILGQTVTLKTTTAYSETALPVEPWVFCSCGNRMSAFYPLQEMPISFPEGESYNKEGSSSQSTTPSPLCDLLLLLSCHRLLVSTEVKEKQKNS